MSPFRLLQSPLIADKEDRFREDPPKVLSSIKWFYYCMKTTGNLRISPFNDPSQRDCSSTVKEQLAASWIFGDEKSLENILAKRRCEYDPKHLPWKAKLGYLEKLKREGRLPQTHPLMQGLTPAAAAGMDVKKANSQPASDEKKSAPGEDVKSFSSAK